MKAIIESIIILLIMSGYHAHAQTGRDTNRLSLGKLEPYRMEVTYSKTSHLLFPAAIRYVDLGSEYILGDTAAANVLRIKAAVRDFSEETNFSVITEDGRFYNFNVFYNPNPATLSYDLLKMQKSSDRENSNDVLFGELGSSSPSLVGLLMENIYKRNKRIVKHIGSKSYGIRFLLKGIYVHDGKYYFHTELRNKSNVPFGVDFVNFKVMDKKVAKRTVVQQKLLTPLRTYKPLDNVTGNKAEQNVFLMDQFTISDDKVLLIEIFERNGGRHQVLQVENTDLVHARLVKDMHLEIK